MFLQCFVLLVSCQVLGTKVENSSMNGQVNAAHLKMAIDWILF
jgi:hypothetical protein